MGFCSVNLIYYLSCGATEYAGRHGPEGGGWGGGAGGRRRGSRGGGGGRGERSGEKDESSTPPASTHRGRARHIDGSMNHPETYFKNTQPPNQQTTQNTNQNKNTQPKFTIKHKINQYQKEVLLYTTITKLIHEKSTSNIRTYLTYN